MTRIVSLQAQELLVLVQGDLARCLLETPEVPTSKQRNYPIAPTQNNRNKLRNTFVCLCGLYLVATTHAAEKLHRSNNMRRAFEQFGSVGRARRHDQGHC